MAVKHLKPTSAGRRWQTISDFSEITCTKPEKSLLEPLPKKAGRNNNGRITTRHQGGGVKRRYRVIDFKRNKDGVPAKVATIEYDPNRSARIALLHYADGEKRYILAPKGLEVGQTIMSGSDADIKPGNALPLADIPVGTLIHAVEFQPGKVGNADHSNIVIGKAGRKRHMNVRPTVRGTVMNPVDHPHGGGEGKNHTSGRPSVTPWGKPTKGLRTRKKKKVSNQHIIRRRKK